METKIGKLRLDHIRSRMGFKNGFDVDCTGTSGGLALWWKEEIDLQILNYSKYHIDALINGSVNAQITLFYGSPYSQFLQASWNLMRKLASFPDRPWMIFGDFNEICFSWERKSHRTKGEWQMRHFREALRDCQLHDLGYVGSPFTFSNRRMGIMETKARLDRALAFEHWMVNFPNFQVRNIATVSSDHMLLLLDFSGNKLHKHSKVFRFEPMWLRCNGFTDTVSTCWTHATMENSSLKNSLATCAAKITEWNKVSVGSVGSKILKLRKELDHIHTQERTNETVFSGTKNSI